MREIEIKLKAKNFKEIGNKFKEKGSSTTCPVAIIIKDRKILLGLRHYTPDKWKAISVWTCPGGRCDEGETIEQVLRREVREEVGITDLEIKDYIGEVPGAKEGDVVPLFLCKTEQDFKLMEPEKFSEWKWVDIKDYINGKPKPYINELSREMVKRFLSKFTQNKFSHLV